jgi:hypothetical protein
LSVFEGTASLDYPTGINSSYQSGSGNFYKTEPARKWINKAVNDLRSQGFQPLPDRPYRAAISYTLRTVRMDVDAPAKFIIDAVARSLCYEEPYVNKNGKSKIKYIGFNDKWVMEIHGLKYKVDHYDDQGVLVSVTVIDP